ncbi:MAG: T9SS type A sorting domain-containing protein [Bacteroidota bacterium]
MNLVLIMVLTGCFMPRASGQGVEYRLNANGISHLFWPFGNGTTYHQRSYVENNQQYLLRMARGHERNSPCNTNGPGTGCHKKEDYWAQDWRVCPNSNSDCHYYDATTGDGTAIIRSPVYGRILNFDDDNQNICSLGGQINIEVLDPFFQPTGFGMQIIHLFDGSVDGFQRQKGELISPGTPLAYIGKTGTSSGDFPHAHVALYRNIYKRIDNQDSLGYRTLKANCSPVPGSCNGGCTIHELAANFRFDATTLGTTCFSDYIQLNQNISTNRVCIAAYSIQNSQNVQLNNGASFLAVSPRVSLEKFSVKFGSILSIKSSVIPYRQAVPKSESEPIVPQIMLSVSPNPFSDKLKLVLHNTQQFMSEIQLFTLDGKQVRKWTLMGDQSMEHALAVSDLAPGLFLLQIRLSDSRVIVKKIHKI